ncbi:MAG: hypothetical protein EOP88_14685 [Verrucomicrobiaceae bacterium]|nr:MAG: hypothetical protein EOP88_14685 [Verrucomicrobiaceae bacterium]
MNREGRPHALLATARIANVPSVVSNVWVGAALGWFASDSTGNLWVMGPLLALAGVFLYIGGNFLNDWMDRKWDAQHRPERALPRGLFQSGFYSRLAAGLLAGGGWLAALVNLRCALVAAAIVLFIVIYTIWHKRGAWTVIPMGLCRAFLPLMGFMAFKPYVDGIWPVSLALLCYIAGLSLTARQESLPNPPAGGGIVSRGLLLSTALLVAWGNRDFPGRLTVILAVLPYLAWTSYCLRFRRKPVPKLVSGLLAGIPLVDWMVLMPLGIFLMPSLTGADGVVGISCMLVPPLAFVCALLLQRVAPAT